MAYDGRLMRRAQQLYEEARARREEEQRARERRLYEAAPRLAEISRELSGTMARLVRSVLRRDVDTQEMVEMLRGENLRLQAERASILTAMGYPADYLEYKPLCPKCGDTGWRGDAVCDCLRAYYTRVQNVELSRLLDLGTQSFETFRFDCYSSLVDPELGVSPQRNMEKNYDVCQDYAHNFARCGGNLLLYGDPGLGKTFLSACIARVVSESGKSVVYDTAGHIFSRFEAQKFSRDEQDGAADDVNRCLACDLLLIDDLGTEMTTAFVQSAFYQIVNGRLMTGKGTVISTNLAPNELSRRYGAAAASRIEGEYQILPFFGEDIRKRLKRM